MFCWHIPSCCKCKYTVLISDTVKTSVCSCTAFHLIGNWRALCIVSEDVKGGKAISCKIKWTAGETSTPYQSSLSGKWDHMFGIVGLQLLLLQPNTDQNSERVLHSLPWLNKIELWTSHRAREQNGVVNIRIKKMWPRLKMLWQGSVLSLMVKKKWQKVFGANSCVSQMTSACDTAPMYLHFQFRMSMFL